MNKLLSYSIALFIMCGTISANATLSESEKILSGFQRVPNVESLPDEIELPAVWVAALRELSKKSLETNETGTEYGVCLNVVAKGIGGDRRQHMEAYRLLLKEKSNMPGDEFAKKERELRRLIASNESGQGDGLVWNAGKIQIGDDSQITMKHGDNVCDGEVASDAHTHPEIDTTVEFSTQDLYYFLKNGRSSFFVINSSFATCLFVKTSAAGTISNNFFWDITTEVTPYKWDGTYSQRLAWYAQTIGVGLYCGNLEKKIKKIVPGQQSLPKVPLEFYILSAKAYLSSLERLEINPTRVASSFTPQLDNTFTNYLTEILSKKKNYIQLYKGNFYIEKSTPQELFRYALSFYHEKNPRSLRNITDIICIAETCLYADDLWKGKPSKYFARFSLATQDTYWIEGNEEAGYHRISKNPKDNTSYEGACKFSEKQCLPDGIGVFKTSDFDYHGEFRNGRMHGDGEIRKSPQNEIYKVKMANDEIKEIKRVK